MSGIDWQTVLALLCVAGAACVLLRRVFALFGGTAAGGCGSGGCGSCENAPSQGGNGSDGFVSVDVLTTTPTAKAVTRRAPD